MRRYALMHWDNRSQQWDTITVVTTRKRADETVAAWRPRTTGVRYRLFDLKLNRKVWEDKQ